MKMKITFALSFLITIAVLCFFGCEDLDFDEKVGQNEEMYIIPENPTTEDVVMLVDTICNYDLFKSLKIDGTRIELSRTFNSAMKWPCIITVDTVSFGQLNKGNYTLIYYLIDRSHVVTDSIYSTDTLYFSVN